MIIIPGGDIYHFKHMPFGLFNAVPTFQHLRLHVLQGLLPNKCLFYQDDVLIIGRNFEEHMSNLREVVNAIKSKGFKVKSFKMSFWTYKCQISWVPDHRWRSFPRSRDSSCNQGIPNSKRPNWASKIGMISYYRQFTSWFSDIAHSLHRLLQKDIKFTWNQSCQDSFDMLKEQLILIISYTQMPVLWALDRF